MTIGNEIKLQQYWKNMSEELLAIVSGYHRHDFGPVNKELHDRLKRFNKTLLETPRNGTLCSNGNSQTS